MQLELFKTIYTQPNCPGCVSLKSKLAAGGIPYHEVVIGKDITREHFMEKFPGVRTVPYVVEAGA